MTTQDEDEDANQNSAYNPFPEPQTIPQAGIQACFFPRRKLILFLKQVTPLKASLLTCNRKS